MTTLEISNTSSILDLINQEIKEVSEFFGFDMPLISEKEGRRVIAICTSCTDHIRESVSFDLTGERDEDGRRALGSLMVRPSSDRWATRKPGTIYMFLIYRGMQIEREWEIG